MIKIYIKGKPLFLVDTITKEIDDYLHRTDTLFIDELNLTTLKTMLQEIEKPDYYAGVFLHHNTNELLLAFKSQLTVIVAAGGLVYTNDNELLLIFRKGKWDLPKGKLDEGEELETCALREIEEETSASALTIENPLFISYHTYNEKGKNILKESHWFLVKANNKSNLQPQTEEDIEKCEWVPVSELLSYLHNAHASIGDVIATGVRQLGLNHP